VTIHYHGTPITPREVLLSLTGNHFCVSYAAPNDIRACHEIGQSVMLDNGAFSFWRSGRAVNWRGYYAWTEEWLAYATSWACIPDIIGGGPEDNDELLAAWPHGTVQGVPVWHLDEPIPRLLHLCENYSKVCFGSSAQYATVGSPSWHMRTSTAFNRIVQTFGRVPYIHMLRGMALSGGPYPFASVDSTDVARNHNRTTRRRNASGVDRLIHFAKGQALSARDMADRWNAMQCPARWEVKWPENA